MGCDIHVTAEVRTESGWADSGWLVFDCRDYGIFGFWADVRNYSESPVIAEPRGLPDDAAMTAEQREEWADGWYHSASWLTLAELLAYDYDQTFWDRRITRDGNGAALAEEGEGRHVTLREFLGAWYFAELERLRSLGSPED